MQIKITEIIILSLGLIILKLSYINSNIRNLERKLWPPMKHIDIWSTTEIKSNEIIKESNQLKNSRNFDNFKFEEKKRNYFSDSLNENKNESEHLRGRHSKVINFFPDPVEDECLSDDGRRSGTCMNPYECRKRSGQAKGECALGFGVCCVLIASCNDEIKYNITYLVSPNFPSFMPNNLTSCKFSIKMLNTDINQLRIDFNHFLLGQPNRTNGNCDGDVLQISGGLNGIFKLCGQNSGQHVYYDIGKDSRTRQLIDSNTTTQPINFANNQLTNAVHAPNENLGEMNDANNDINQVQVSIKISSKIIQTRLWEMKIMQIPFSQRAPAGCLQYFPDKEGIIQTFNFADNGRHLSNQNYKSCIRQEKEMCSIVYRPCDEHSFRIGQNVDSPTDDPLSSDTELPITTQSSFVGNTTGFPAQSDLQTLQSMTSESVLSAAISSTTETQFDDVAEGSGGGTLNAASSISSSPVRGGFDIMSFLSNTIFDFRRRRSLNNRFSSESHGRQFFPRCQDRITMPCIVEDFIVADKSYGFPNCQPVHCGSSFCPNENIIANCRIESTVTPFYLGVHFGNGDGKGSPEENIGACLKYSQMPCL